jgi:hypothetical protein
MLFVLAMAFRSRESMRTCAHGPSATSGHPRDRFDVARGPIAGIVDAGNDLRTPGPRTQAHAIAREPLRRCESSVD